MTIPLQPSPGLYPSSTLFPGPQSSPSGGFSNAPVGHVWSAFSRDPDYALDRELPIASVQIVAKHMGVSRAVITTPYSPERYASMLPPAGVSIYRDGKPEFAGPITELDLDWDAETGRALIKASCVGDEVIFEDRISFPDPARAPEDQTVNDYWASRDSLGNIVERQGSVAMMQLIDDQAGPAAHVSRRVPDLRLGFEPGVGVTRVYSALFHNVMHALAVFSVASGANIGLRMTVNDGRLFANLTTPRNLSASIKFSANLSNLAGVSYRLVAPTLTDAVAAGQGDLKARMRRHVGTTDPNTTVWGRSIWQLVDRRDTPDPAELTQAASDAVLEGAQTVSLAVTLADSEAATYGRDWGLGDRVTVHVGLPGQPKAATVVDVVREILFDVDERGVERIRPAIGTYDAKALVPTPTQQQLANVSAGLAGLIARR